MSYSHSLEKLLYNNIWETLPGPVLSQGCDIPIPDMYKLDALPYPGQAKYVSLSSDDIRFRTYISVRAD